MQVFRTSAIWLVVAGCACASQVTLDVELAGPQLVRATLRGHQDLGAERLELYRSTTDLSAVGIDTVAFPVTVLGFSGEPGEARLADSMVAHNVTYHYRALVVRRNGEETWSSVDSVSIPDVELGRITGSSLLIDKLHYFLEVRDGGMMKKRYPVALGSKPRNRKLHMDRASTPEGFYRITNEQPDATFHKAFDIDYPNEVDRCRYNLHRELDLLPERHGDVPLIGGEIQIHGEGIERNWTFGCIALRNRDMDELFEHDRVGKGMPVYIVGSEVTRAGLRSVMDYRTDAEMRRFQRKLKEAGLYEGEPDGIIGSGTRRALGLFQRRNGLPMTCDFDAPTVRLLRAQ